MSAHNQDCFQGTHKDCCLNEGCEGDLYKNGDCCPIGAHTVSGTNPIKLFLNDFYKFSKTPLLAPYSPPIHLRLLGQSRFKLCLETGYFLSWYLVGDLLAAG